MRWVNDWRQAYKFLSVHAALLVVAWGMTPPEQQAALMEWIGLAGSASYVTAVLGFLVIYARLVAQAPRE